MKKKLLAVFLVLVFGALSFYNPSQNSALLKLTYYIPDTPEVKEVMKTVERAYDVEAEAAYTFDIKKLSTVFINDPRFPVSAETLQTVRELTGNPSLDSAGYLDYKLAYYSWTVNATLHAEKIKERAKEENRALTEEETKSLVDENGRLAPARPQTPKRESALTFLSVNIDEDVATVVVDDGPWTLEMYLVLVDHKWYVAGVKGVIFHP